jgi:hypothetical protein
MTRTTRLAPGIASLAGCLVQIVFSAPALAQGIASQPANQGPMTVERIQNGWAIAPSVKLTQFDSGTHTLAGAYGGWVMDNRLLVGAAGYWLTDPSRTRNLSYGGGLVEWRQRVGRPLGFSVKGLIGGGSATVATTVSVRGLDRDLDPRFAPVVTTRQFAFREDFFVAEPEADLLVNISSHVRLHVGGGYRAVTGAHGIDEDIRGATGSVALEIGPSSRR